MNDYELWQMCHDMRQSGKHFDGIVHRVSLTDVAGVCVDRGVIFWDGTDTWQEWAGNIFAFRTKYGVHQSYQRSALDLVVQLMSCFQDRNKLWTVCGISRGGAIAEINASIMARMGLSVRLVTFGAPSAGKTQFYNGLYQLVPDTTHYEIDGDIVCGMPKWWGKPKTHAKKLPRQSKNIIKNHLSYGRALYELLGRHESTISAGVGADRGV